MEFPKLVTIAADAYINYYNYKSRCSHSYPYGINEVAKEIIDERLLYLKIEMKNRLPIYPIIYCIKIYNAYLSHLNELNDLYNGFMKPKKLTINISNIVVQDCFMFLRINDEFTHQTIRILLKG